MRIGGAQPAQQMYKTLDEARRWPALTIFDSGRVLWSRSPRQRARVEPMVVRDMGERPLYRINVRLK